MIYDQLRAIHLGATSTQSALSKALEEWTSCVDSFSSCSELIDEFESLKPHLANLVESGNSDELQFLRSFLFAVLSKRLQLQPVELFEMIGFIMLEKTLATFASCPSSW